MKPRQVLREVAVLAYNVLSLLQRAVEQAHRQEHPQLEVSTYHLAEHVKSGYEGMLIAVPTEHWPHAAGQTAQSLAETLLRLARRVLPSQVAISKRVHLRHHRLRADLRSIRRTATAIARRSRFSNSRDALGRTRTL